MVKLKLKLHTSTASALRAEALHERADDEVPTIDQHEQEELEREGDRDGRHHHHAQSHQDGRHQEIDDEKRQKKQKAHLKGRLQFTDHKRRNHDAHRQGRYP